MYANLSSHEARLVAVGENSQCRTQLLCFLRVYCSLRSMVDHTLMSLSSPQEVRSSPSQEKLSPLILAWCALTSVVYLLECS
jgi:hypothetical protein